MKSLNLLKNAMTGLHIASMLFGLYGLVFLPLVPEFMNNLPPQGQAIFDFGMTQGGPVYILFGAVAVLIYGIQTIGWQRLLMFLVPALLISLASELLGTSTGFPFGSYAYTPGLLGPMILGLVPFTIPLSWFYMGFVCYILARAAFSESRGIVATVGPLLLGAWFLTAWDLVLDPAMAVASGFWSWKEGGPFFGMPFQNFAGWFGTGLLFMAVARWLWKSNVAVPNRAQLTLPLIIYTSNMLFSAVMSVAAGLYIPVVLGFALGLLPVVWIWLGGTLPSSSQLSGVTD
ncbi:MAG: carotenoid biosynthesis protein [Gemmatimonadaceae bacterium]|nr:carotenoid biosynthesis protein [Gloeobacterales cyanobacterium ES-bin-141]